mgnify:CR=1 FL=1
MKSAKKPIKKAITAGLIGLASILPMSKANAGALSDRLSISAGYSMSNADCMKDFYQQVNQNAKDGKYTGGIRLDGLYGFPAPTPSFREIQSPKGLNMLEGKLDYRFFKGLSASLGYGSGSISTSSYDVYRMFDAYYGYFNMGLDRAEKADITKTSVGLKLEKNLGKLFKAFIQGNYDMYNVEGKCDMTILIDDAAYQQWRKASFSGSGNGFSVKAGGQFFVMPNFAIGLSAGYQAGNIQTKGSEVKTANTCLLYTSPSPRDS